MFLLRAMKWTGVSLVVIVVGAFVGGAWFMTWMWFISLFARMISNQVSPLAGWLGVLGMIAWPIFTVMVVVAWLLDWWRANAD